MTNIFEQSEIRGVDASGFWGVESTGKIIYHKEPIKSSELIKKDIWKKLQSFNANLLLAHARGASMGVGTPNVNKNNHPFTSTDKNISLIHNGRVPDSEYELLVKKYEVSSKCDSEILLRIIEGAEEHNEAKELFPNHESHIGIRLCGIKDIFSYTFKTHMAVAVGEKLDDNRYLWLFRNRQRSLWLIDLRKELGQIFFCSTPEIAWEAANQCSAKKLLKNKIKLIELPEDEVWFFKTIDNEINFEKFSVISGQFKPIQIDEENKIKINKKTTDTKIISNLNENDELFCQQKCVSNDTNQTNDIYATINLIKMSLNEITHLMKNLNKDQLDNLSEYMMQHYSDLEKTLKIIKK